MQQQEPKSFSWVDKYRPKTIDECILPERIKTTFKGYLKKKEFPNLLLTGSPGTGKTTIARALCEEMDYDYIVINASRERNIDTVRMNITQFASTRSLRGAKKAIILDEADGLNPTSAQPALRAAIEEYSDVRFILTCNYKNKLIAPLHSRTTTVSFDIKKKERENTMVKFMVRLKEILEDESVKYDLKVLAEVVKKYYPDNRKILNELYSYSIGYGEIDTGILLSIDKADVKELVSGCKERNITRVRQWVVNNLDVDSSAIFDEIYSKFYTEIEPESIPQLIILIGEYQYKSAFVASQEINMMAFLMEVIGSVDFKD